AVRRVHRDAADRAVPHLLLYLEDDLAGGVLLGGHDDGVQQVRQLPAWELHVHHGADHPADPAGRGLLSGLCSLRHLASPERAQREVSCWAAAPPTISSSSAVIVAWRTLFAVSVSDLMMSPAALVAFCIAI